MITIWRSRIGTRGRKPHCVLVTKDGIPHLFTRFSLISLPIPGVCYAQVIGGKKEGKWSYYEYEIVHHCTTAVVQWHDDWTTLRPFPQRSWEEGYFWMAERAPLLRRDAFEAFIRENFPKAAAEWDAARAAEEKYGFPATANEAEAIEAEKERVAAEKAAYEAELKRRMEDSPFAVLSALKCRT